jgi:hypothetical protein
MKQIFDAKTVPVGTQVFDSDEAGKKALSDAMKQVVDNGSATVDYKERQITMFTGSALLNSELV